jgi:hypothetical protein
MTYNGWANYETWCVYLWISNERWFDSYAIELARAYGLEGLEDGSLAQAFKDWIEDLRGGRAALSEVHWQEIAKAYSERLDND